MQGALKIGRLRTECQVSGVPEIAPAVVDRATRALRNHLPDTLRGVFARWLDRADESVWIVRRIDLSVLAAADAPPDMLAASVATSLGRALGDVLVGDGDGVNAIRFPSRAAYLGQFLVDAAAGDAGRRWYHAPFAGLRVLSSSATIRTALVDDPGRGRAALAPLDDGALARVAAALTPEDERRVLDAFATTSAGSGTTDDAFAAAWVGCAQASRHGVERGQALFAFVRADPAVAAVALARAARLVVEALRAAEAAAPKRARTLAIVGGQGSRHGSAPSSIPHEVPPAVARLILAHTATRQDSGRTADGAETVATPFGGLFLLLRDLDSLPWEAWTADWPAPGAGTASAVLAWLTLAVCAGRGRARRALEDDAVRALYAIPPAVGIPDVSRWLRAVGGGRRQVLERELSTLDPTAVVLTAQERAWLALPRSAGIGKAWREALACIARTVLRRFAHRLPGFSESTPEHLWRNFLAFRATIDDEGERVVVRCGRPPLHLVLTLTGMTRGLVAGRDAHGRPILVFPQE